MNSMTNRSVLTNSNPDAMGSRSMVKLQTPFQTGGTKSLIFLFLLIGILAGRSELAVTSSGVLDATMYNGKLIIPQESSKNNFRATVSADGKWLFEISPLHGTNDPLHRKTDIIY